MEAVPAVSIKIPRSSIAAQKENVQTLKNAENMSSRKRGLGDKSQIFLPEGENKKRAKTAGVVSFDVKVAKKIHLKKQVDFDKQVLIVLPS